MVLRIWTAARQDAIGSTIGAALRRMRPDVPPHEFIPWKEGGNDLPLSSPDGVLLVCGNRPLEDLQRAGLVPKNRKVNSLREQVLRIRPHGPNSTGVAALVTFDPGIVSSEPDKSALIDWDVRLATRYLRIGSLAPKIGDYRYVSSFEPTIEAVKQEYARTGEAVPVSLDLETMGFVPWYPDKDILSIQFTVIPGTADVMYLGPQKAPVELLHDPEFSLLDQVRWLLTTPLVKLVGSNLKFDLIWVMVKLGIRCTNFRFDLFLAASLLDENRSNGLSTLVKICDGELGGYDLEFDRKYDKSRMELVTAADDFLVYSGGDSDGTLRSYHVIRRELLEQERLANFYVTILHPAARAFENIEMRGVHVDQQRFHVLRKDLVEARDRGYKRALEILPVRMRTKYRDRIDEQLRDGKSPFLPSLLKEYFFSPMGLNLRPRMLTKETQQPSTKKAHLRMFRDVPDAKDMVEALTEADVAAKGISTFVDGFLSHLRPDGLLHPTYFLGHGEFDEVEDDDSGTVSGRLSAKNPAAQIIPKKTFWAKRIRECFVAPPGKVILQPDYVQGELKVVACIADEKNMLSAYEAGMDLHAVTGARLGEVPYEEFLTWKANTDEKLQKLFKDLRDRAKAGNFGLLYGMGVEGFMAYAWANYGLILTYMQAAEIRDAFFKLYPGLVAYHERQKNLVTLHGEVWSPLGRCRHLPTIKAWDREHRARAERQAINSPIQATLTDMLIWSLALIEDAYPNDEIATFIMIHDAFGAYVDEDKVELRAKQIAEIMENLPFHEVGWSPQLKFTAEAEAGPDMGNLHEVVLAA